MSKDLVRKLQESNDPIDLDKELLECQSAMPTA